MAISLRDTRKVKNETENLAEEVLPKEKSLRPWSSPEEWEGQTRTLAAKEAAHSASQQSVVQIPVNRSLQGMIEVQNISMRGLQGKKSNGLFGFMRYLLKKD